MADEPNVQISVSEEEKATKVGGCVVDAVEQLQQPSDLNQVKEDKEVADEESSRASNASGTHILS